MKNRDRYLSSILLVLIGIIIGTLFAFYQQQNMVEDHAEVDVTEIKHSNKPLLTDEQLGKMDSRFLFKKVAERVTPMVVKLETVVPLSSDDLPDDRHHEQEGPWGNILPKRAHTVGSGIVISSDGYILTNNHVIQGAVDNKIEVALNDKRKFEGRVVGQDPTTDLAVLKIGAQNLPAMTIGNSNEVEVGEWVLAIGNPFRLNSTVTAGIVSALSRDMQIINDQMRVESFIQTDAAINKGNSGGPLVNTSGELIGINTAIASQSGNYQGYGFAVPSNLAAKVAEDLIEHGEVRRALLGVAIQAMDETAANQLDMDEIRGVQITEVSPGGAADKAGLRANDIILSIDSIKVNEANQLQQKIAVKNPGEIVNLQVLRDGKKVSKSVELGMINPDREQFAISGDQQNSDVDEQQEEQNEESPTLNDIQYAVFDLGMRVRALSHEDSTSSDLVITDVIEGTEASEKGLKEGFKIIKVGDQKVEDLETLKDLVEQILEEKNSVTLEVKNLEGAIKLVKLLQ